MTKRSSKPRKKPSRRPGRSTNSGGGIAERWQSINSPGMKRLASPAAWAAGIAAIIAAWWIGVPKLQAYAATNLNAPAPEIVFTHKPSWMKGDIEKGVILTARMFIEGNPLERDDLVGVRIALLNTGWFDDVTQVRRAASNRIEVDALFARPLTVVRDNEGDHLIDTNGRLMPLSYRRGEAPPFIPILGAQFDRPPRPGVLWEGLDIIAARDVLPLIKARPWAHQVEAIDVSRYLQDGSLSLISDRGCVIKWGRAPGDPTPAEVTTRQKLAYLDYHFENYQHIDLGFEHEVDITGDYVNGR